MSPADTSLTIAERVDAVCDHFESQWHAGKRPRIENDLTASSDAIHDEILRALIPVELELLRREGRYPAESDYQQRFPNHSKLISEIFATLSASNAGAADTSVVNESVCTPTFNAKTPIATQVGPAPLAARIGRFQVISVLGEGAFGRVYRAKDPQLGREVAIKVPFDKAVQTEADRERFLREARAAAGIHHPNICPVHEIGQADGKPYIVMALIPGDSLSAIIKARKLPLPEKEVAVIIRRLALALNAAHSKGVVHRDLKPANVMFDRERKDLVVTDFGLARGPQVPDELETQSGIIMGTPAYMSPEQARGGSKSVGPAADIYSLGIILYELLAECRPYAGSPTEVFGQILHVQPQPPSKHRPNIDPRLEAACLKAIAKDPAARFATMKEFAAAMDAILRTPTGSTIGPAKTIDSKNGGEASPGTDTRRLADIFAALATEQKQETEVEVGPAIRKSRTPRWVFVLTGLILVGGLAAVAGLVFFTKSDKMKVTIELTDVDLSDKSLSFFLNDEPIAAEALANPIELKQGEHVLTVKRGKEITKRLLLTVSGGSNPGITTKDITPSPPDVIPLKKIEMPPPPKLAPSPLDVLKAADIPDAILTKIYGGRDKAPQELVGIIKNIGTDTRDRYTAFDLDPEGKFLASAQFPWSMIEVRNLVNGKKLADVANDPTNNTPYFYWVKFSPDGKTLYGVRKDEDLYAFDLQGKQLWRLPMRGNFSTPALSPDGSTLIVPEANAEGKALRVIDARTGAERTKWQDLFSTATCRIEFSPDGKTLALFTGALKLIDPKDGSVRKKFDGSVLGHPVFSRDGSKIYYSRDYKQTEDHFAEVTLASGETREYRLPPLGCRNPVVNPVYPIIVASDRGKDIHFWDADLGPNQKPYTLPIGVSADRYQFTPDGRYLIVGSDNGVYVLRLPVERKVADWKPIVQKSDNSGFVPLFNGKDLSGWRAVGDPKWTWSDGRVLGSPAANGQGGILLSEADYDDFEIKLQFRLAPGAGSGLFFRMDPAASVSSPAMRGGQLKVQLIDDDLSASQAEINKTGSIYETFARKEKPPIKKGDWNYLRVRLDKRNLKVWVNEVQTIAADLDTAPEHAHKPGLTRKAGRIGMQQNHKSDVEFRDIWIKPLNEGGFVPLFNGKDLTGWESTRAESFSVDAEGNIVAAGDTLGSMQWLVTKKDYADYVLRLEFLIVKGPPTHTNSGVAIRAAPGQTGENGTKLRVQIRNEANQKPQPGAVVYTGANSIEPSTPPTPKPAGEWNTMEIEVRGTQIKVSMNGTSANDVDLSKIHRSTFTQKEKGYATADLDRKTGRIGLQSFRGEIKFRNIQIKDLDAPKGN